MPMGLCSDARVTALANAVTRVLHQNHFLRIGQRLAAATAKLPPQVLTIPRHVVALFRHV